MLMIRLFRIGRKNQPSYKVVVTEKTNAPARGRFVEEVGFYNPLTKEKKFNAERIKYWISVGAQLSDTIHNMLVKEKIIEGALIPKHGKAKKKEEESAAPTTEQPTEVKTEETPTAEEPAEASEEKPVESTPEPETKEEKPAEPEVKKESVPESETKEETPVQEVKTETKEEKPVEPEVKEEVLPEKEKTE